jgi:hypothetical protein
LKFLGVTHDRTRGGVCVIGTLALVDFTTEKLHSFIGTNEYIQIIFIGPKTDEYKVISVGIVQALMNMWAVRFDFN